MKQSIAIIVLIIGLSSCERHYPYTIGDLRGTWWFTPVDQNHLTDIIQIHWNRDTDLIINFKDGTERSGHSDVVDRWVYMDGERIFLIIDRVYHHLYIEVDQTPVRMNRL